MGVGKVVAMKVGGWEEKVSEYAQEAMTIPVKQIQKTLQLHPPLGCLPLQKNIDADVRGLEPLPPR